MTLKNNRAPFLCYFKHCASFRDHQWIQTLEISDFLSHVSLKFEGWPKKTKGHLFYTTSSFVHNFVAICKFELELQSGNAPKLGQNLFWPLWPWPLNLTLTFCMGIIFVNGNDSWKFNDDKMTGTLWKRCHRQMEGWTDRQIDGRMDRSDLRAAWSQLKISRALTPYPPQRLRIISLNITKMFKPRVLIDKKDVQNH